MVSSVLACSDWRPGAVLAGAAIIAPTLLEVSAGSIGLLSGWSLLAAGLVNAIMLPAIISVVRDLLRE